jgi:hypothetical protein
MEGDYNSIIMVKISDCGSEVSNDGIPFNLAAQVLVPGVITDDYEKILPGQHLCLKDWMTCWTGRSPSDRRGMS